MTCSVRHFFFCICMLSLALFAMGAEASDDKRLSYFRIGTGEVDDVSFYLGGIIANAISKPPGMPACEKGGNCGVPGMVAIARSSDGSIRNIEQILSGKLDGAFVQSDILYWAFEGKEMFKDKAKKDLRVLSSLFQETLHLVVRKESKIYSVADLRGKRISFGKSRSDSFLEGRFLLQAYGLRAQDLTVDDSPVGEAVSLLRAGKIDGFFTVSARPSLTVAELAREELIRLVPIAGKEAKKMTDEHSFLHRAHIEAGTYYNLPEIETLSLPTIFVTTEKISEITAYRIMQALWHRKTREYLERVHPSAREVTYGTSFEGVATPLHVGALRFHEELEILKAQRIRTLDAPPSKGWNFSIKAIAGGLDEE